MSRFQFRDPLNGYVLANVPERFLVWQKIWFARLLVCQTHKRCHSYFYSPLIRGRVDQEERKKEGQVERWPQKQRKGAESKDVNKSCE